MEKLRWGIIGCGDVTEHKSGPAFNKVPHSQLYAVMRRNIEKARDYANRHAVPVYYNDAHQLINDDHVNAIYIATPPDTHETYAMQAIEAGKPVYVEKPMTIDYASALRLQAAVDTNNAKLCVAHYRNAQPFFLYIKEVIDKKLIGNAREVLLNLQRTPYSAEDMKNPGKAWRVDPAVSGGGLFHDLAPHQLAFLLMLFEKVTSVKGEAIAHSLMYNAADEVKASIRFQHDIYFEGRWDFSAKENVDECIIRGSHGFIRFAFFGEQLLEMHTTNGYEKKHFAAPLHVQQPMIEKLVQYFLEGGSNPCPVSQGVEVMRLMELVTKH